MTFAKAQKFKHRFIFARLGQMPRVAKSRLFRCHGVPYDAIDPAYIQSAPYPKVAFVISKKEAKLSPHRNKIKRRFQEALRVVLDRLPDVEYYGLIFLLRGDILTVPHAELIEHIYEAMSKSMQPLDLTKYANISNQKE